MRSFYCLLFSLFSTLCAQEQVDLIVNWPLTADPFNEMLAKHEVPVTVKIKKLEDYGKQLRKKQDRFSKFLSKANLDFPKQVSLDKNTSKIIFYNINPSYLKKFHLERFPKEKMILFMWEPPCVLGNMYRDKTLSLFSKIYTWDDDLVDNVRYFKFYYPVLQPMTTDIPSFEEKKLCTLISSDLKSRYPGELYSERLRAIEFFEKNQIADFEFYGRKWDKNLHPAYRGALDDKLSTLKKYRFSICYENSTNIKGYVTEKIFDAFAAGNVPIYWGASNIEEYVPKDCFIDRRDFHSIEELYQFIRSMKKEEYNGYLVRIRAFLESEQAKKFSPAHYEDILLKLLNPEQNAL